MRNLHLSWWLAPTLIGLILWALSSVTARGRLREIYTAHIAQTSRERQFLAAVGFFVTIAVVRALTFLIHADIGPFHDVEVHGRHIHHLVWGIALLLLVGYGWLLEIGTGTESSATWTGRAASMMYGVGAALTLDEFALWLNLRDVYWEHEGRESIEAIFLFGGLLGIGIYGRSFLGALGREFVRVFRSSK